MHYISFTLLCLRAASIILIQSVYRTGGIKKTTNVDKKSSFHFLTSFSFPIVVALVGFSSFRQLGAMYEWESLSSRRLPPLPCHRKSQHQQVLLAGITQRLYTQTNVYRDVPEADITDDFLEDAENKLSLMNSFHWCLTGHGRCGSI